MFIGTRIKTALRNGKMQIPGDQWPIFLYACCEYNPEDPWNGAFRSAILVSVILPIFYLLCWHNTFQAYKYVFTLPSSVDKVSRATRSGNVHIHGMMCVTMPPIAYIATRVCLYLLVAFNAAGAGVVFIGPLRPELLSCFLPDGHNWRLGTLLR